MVFENYDYLNWLSERYVIIQLKYGYEGYRQFPFPRAQGPVSQKTLSVVFSLTCSYMLRYVVIC